MTEITVKTARIQEAPAQRIPMFKALLGAEFAQLDSRLRRVHGGEPGRWRGRVSVERGNSILAVVLAWLASLPPRMTHAAIEVGIRTSGGAERWERLFGGSARMASTLSAEGSLLVERLGPVALYFKLVVRDAGIDWILEKIRVVWIPVPIAWFQTSARIDVRNGRYHFHVESALRGIGKIVRYDGYLDAQAFAPAERVIVFDGICHVCSGWVRFLRWRRIQPPFRAISMQTPDGKALLRDHGIDPDDPATFLILDGGRHYTESDAAIHVLVALGGLWRLASAAKLVPKRWRDTLYQVLAKNRYRWFGQRTTCYLPDP
jgi:predicted DCC family thiol-disulfide oxidoreductase YuxK